jgi:hypothetical protein
VPIPLPATTPIPLPAATPRTPRHFAHDSPPLELEEDDAAVLAAELAKHRRSLEGATGGVDLPLRERVRSGALLVLLLIGIGTFAAILIGLGIVGLITGLRTAIG